MPELLQPSLSVSLGGRAHTYPLYIGAGLLHAWGQILASVRPACKRVLVVTDESVARLYRDTVQQGAGLPDTAVFWLVLPAGESEKTLDSWQRILEAAYQARLSRHDAIVALGGGVVGDLAGFAAATYYRGTGFVQLPTTLLAQVDSSVGGKTGLNFGQVKNGVGAFYQPHAVVMDTQTLQTLPQRELVAGLAEVFKYSLIEWTARADTSPPSSLEVAAPLFAQLEQMGANWSAQASQFIQRCCAIKAAVVQRDETESLPAQDATGRVCLNLGHTFAHAYEAFYGYGQLLHGEAVAVGTRHALDLAVALGLLPAAHRDRALGVMAQLALPLSPPQPVPTADTLLALMQRDKKAADGTLRLIVPAETLGQVVVRDNVTAQTLAAVLGQAQQQ